MKTLPALDSFTRAYLDACLWSSTDDETPLDQNYSVTDFAPEALARAADDCERFLASAGDMIPPDRTETAGHDFWLTRNGHGCGFWDGDWLEHGDALTVICKQFGQLDPYVGDDGQIYF